MLNDVIYVRTNDGAPRYKLYAVDPKRPERARWTRVIPEDRRRARWRHRRGSDLIATYLVGCLDSQSAASPRAASRRDDVQLPTLGSSSRRFRHVGRATRRSTTSRRSRCRPTIFRLDPRLGAIGRVGRRSRPPSIPDAFEVERIRATSKDGTKMPMFVVHKKGLAKDGQTPTLLTGYGGFNVNIVPPFTRASYLLLERGGVLAVANLRGGGEFGEEWHRAGMLEQQAERVRRLHRRAERARRRAATPIARAPRDHGRARTAACSSGALVTQRPDLFRAAVCSVPLLDMLRYHLFRHRQALDPRVRLGRRSQCSSSGSTPTRRTTTSKAGTRYPAVLFTTAESDSRVDPLHARKMAAALQAATTSDRPILLRVETQGRPRRRQAVAKARRRAHRCVQLSLQSVSVSV